MIISSNQPTFGLGMPIINWEMTIIFAVIAPTISNGQIKNLTPREQIANLTPREQIKVL